MVAAALTDVAGASRAFDWGVVTYSNAAKMQLLGLSGVTLDTHGAVSEPVVIEMAQGALVRSGGDLAISVSGVAGPGGTAAKPEGMVCFGLASAKGARAETVLFGALGRVNVRRAATDHALAMLQGALSASTP